MGIIKEYKIDKDVSIRLYEAPVDILNSKQIGDWVYQGIPRVGGPINAFWEIYNACISKEDATFYDRYEDESERQKFIQNPLILGMSKESLENRVFGGIWFENLGNGEIELHIKCKRGNYRKYAHYLLEHFTANFQTQYKRATVNWGPREEKDNPTKFLQRNGFEINYTNNSGGLATLNL